MTTLVIAKIQGIKIEDVLRERYPGDEGTGVILKAAMAPAMTTVAGWAAELSNIVVADFLNQLPISRSIRSSRPRARAKFTFGTAGVIKIPARSGRRRPGQRLVVRR